MLKKKVAMLLAVAMVAATVVGCGGNGKAETDAPADDASKTEAPADDAKDDAEAPADDADAEAPADDADAEAPAASGDLKIGVINNDPNESGYRTANDKDLKAAFPDAQFAYGKSNDEQIKAAQQLIQDGIDYLLLSAADTAGWDGVLQEAKDNGTKVILFDRVIDADESLYEASIVSDMEKEGADAVQWLKDQNLDEYKIIHIQGQMGTAAQVGRSGALSAAVEENDNWSFVGQPQTGNWSADEAKVIVESAISSGEKFNVIYAENDDMAKGAVAALDAAGITHGKDGDVIIMGFDCNKWALQELLDGNWNFDGQCNPFQSSYIKEVIDQLEAGEEIAEKKIIMQEKTFDCNTITAEDVETYGI